MLIFSLDPGSPLGPALAAALDETLARHEDRRFEDGEHKWRPLTDPRGDDVYVLSSLHGHPPESPHDRLCRLLVFMATLRDHGAARVTAVLPYLAYARKDRRTQPLDPLPLRVLAQLFEAVHTDQLLVLEPHNPGAVENAFRCPVQCLDAHPLFDLHLAQAIPPSRGAGAAPLAVASPDPGGVKRAQLWREALEERLQQPVGFAMVDKRRRGGEVSGGELVAGDVAGHTVLLRDDLVASGGTLQRAAVALRQAGAAEVLGFAAHGLFTGGGTDRDAAPGPLGDAAPGPLADAAPGPLADAALGALVVSDSVPPFRLPAAGPVAAKLRVVSVVPLLARAIRESHAAWLR